MKKLFSIILALSMTVALLCNPALAALEDPSDGADNLEGFSQSVEVQIKQVGGETIHKYSADVEYGDMVFTYRADNKQWVPDEQQYETISNGSVGWSGNGTLILYNHSDLAIDYTITPVITNDDHRNLTIKTDNDSGRIAKCNVNDELWSHFASATISIEGVPSGLSTQVVLGQVNVVFSAVIP